MPLSEGVYFSHKFYVGLMKHLPYHSQKTAFITQKCKSWASFKLVAKNYQYSKITEMGVQVLKIIQFKRVGFRAGTPAERSTAPP